MVQPICHCVYSNCNRQCTSTEQHRAVYASMTSSSKDNELIVITEKSQKINHKKLKELKIKLDKWIQNSESISHLHKRKLPDESTSRNYSHQCVV